METGDKKNLRIDYSKYQVEEVMETISGAILFPIYIGEVAVKVVLVFVAVIAVLAYLFTNHFLLGLLFFIVALVVSSPSIVIASAIQLLHTIRDDINKVVSITVETTKHIYDDANLLKEQQESGVPLKSSFNDVFRGVALYVIRPSLNKVLERRIKFFAWPFTFLVDTLFKYVAIKRQPSFDVSVTEGGEVSVAGEGAQLTTKIKDSGSKVTSNTVKVVRFPLLVLLVVYSTFNALLIWFLAWLF